MESGVLRLPRDGGAPDAADFRRLFETEFGYVWRSLRRLGIPPRDLEDVTHDVFLRVYAELHRFDPERAPRPWLFGFAFRVASDYRRLSRNHREVLDADVEGADPLPSAVDRLLEAESLSMGYAALDGIDIDRRAVFILHELDGASIPDIARALGLPLNTAYSRLRAAREEFNAAVRRLRLRRGDR
jgi:RNA polymerase sigma-70 factor (ECF subfamily)